jgi:TPR repeat protein
MADLAHDASGPASSEPAGIALQQANRPTSSDKGKLRVFISYSRDDLKFADQLDAALNACGFGCLIDREGISGGEDWKRRLGDLISEADTVVFALSPSSARSPMCDWEVEEAARLNKRILPVNCRPLDGVSPPARLRDLNYIFFYDEPKVSDSGFGTGLANLITALNTDFDWLREHTRYLQRALEWNTGGRPATRLLSGNDILEAKAWAARRPKGASEPTALHLEFIRASEEEAEARLSEQRKQLEAVAAAQAAKETALNAREDAVKQAADAQQQASDAERRRARIRNIAFVVVSILVVLAGWRGWDAENQKEQADDILARATGIIGNLQDQMDVKTKQEAVALFQAGAIHGDETSMYNLGILFQNGQGVTRDDAKAREWFKNAADKGNTDAMVNLGLLFEYGQGGPQDYAKAREWYEKGAAQGNAMAKTVLEQLAIHEAETAGRYAEALRLLEALAAKDEAEETKSDGKPGKDTEWALTGAIWDALLAKEFTKALTVADRAHELFPDDLVIESNRAHALMFMEHDEEAKALYVVHKGAPVSGADNKLWEQNIAEDFAKLREAGLTSPMMVDVEKELGISR